MAGSQTPTVVGVLLGIVIGGGTLWSLNGAINEKKERLRLSNERWERRKLAARDKGVNRAKPKPAVPGSAVRKKVDLRKPVVKVKPQPVKKSNPRAKATAKNVAAPPAPVALVAGERYLRDLKPTQIFTLRARSFKLDREFTLAGVKYEHSLSLHARFLGRGAHAIYKLDKPYKRLRGAAGVADNPINGSKSPMTFVVVADGKELWRSAPMQKSGEWAAFDVDIAGVKELKLAVEAGRLIDGAHASWLEPKLVE